MQMQYLAAMLGHQAVAGPTLQRAGGGEYGNALLTRRRVLDVRRIDLTVYRREPRGAIDVDLDIEGRIVRVVVTHLGLLPGERRKQVRRLLDLLGGGRSDAVVLCGDINEWFAVGRPLRWLHARLGRTAAVPTFPAAFPVFALDRIWVHPRAARATLTAHASPAARRASDHLPLLADIRLDPA
jgi:endonuclease/exonuclease/phosphatase family metal-dependent hydrolase